MSNLKTLALAAVLAVAPLGAMAETEVWIGGGAGVVAEYEGADDYQPIPLLSFLYESDTVNIEVNGFTAEIDLVPSPKFQFGPYLKYRFGRDDDVSDNRVARLPEVDDAFEVGAQAMTGLPVTLLGLEDPAILTVRATFAHDVADAHDGFWAQGAVGVFRPLGQDFKGVMSLSTTYASSEFMQTYFGVSGPASAASGLRAFDADAGFKDVGLTSVLIYSISDRWTASLIGTYKRLVGDAADSPLVKDAGSPDQFFGGVTVKWRAF